MDQVKRGYEIYARELFELLRDEPDFQLTLIKGSGARRAGEKVVFSLPRDSRANRWLCRLVGERWKYYIEYVSFALGLLPVLLFNRFDVFYVVEAPLYKFLNRWRRISRGRFRLIHFTGGQLCLLPATDKDYLHHVTPCYASIADQCGFRRDNQFLIPHFIDTSPSADARDGVRLECLRRQLGIQPGVSVILSVGAIDAQVKRMDYVISECAALTQPIFLLLIGHQDAASAQIHALAHEKLGPDRFAILTVPHEAIFVYYALADVFVLASLREGFGLVFLEALACGAPVIAHDYDVSRYVLQDQGHFADLSIPGTLTSALQRVLATPSTELHRSSRLAYVQRRYEATTLKSDYRQMFLQVCGAG